MNGFRLDRRIRREVENSPAIFYSPIFKERKEKIFFQRAVIERIIIISLGGKISAGIARRPGVVESVDRSADDGMTAGAKFLLQGIGQGRLARCVDTVHCDRQGAGGFSSVYVPGNFMHRLIVVHR